MSESQPSEWLSFRLLAQHISHRRKITSDEALHILLSAFWLGEFGDGSDSQVARDQGQGWWPEYRELVLGCMPKTWLPEIIRRTELSDMDDKRWRVLADMPIQDYPPDYRHQVLETLHIKRPAYEAWARKVRFPVMDEPSLPPRGRGRPGARKLYLAEFKHRLAAGEAFENLREEARYLRSFLKQAYPAVIRPKVKSIADSLYKERDRAQK